MPDLQPSLPSATPVVLDTAPAPEDTDFALGCECADPALQIERWMQEARGGGSEAN